MPCAGVDTCLIVSGSLSGSLSLASTGIVTGVPMSVVAESSVAWGGWLTLTIVQTNEAEPVNPPGSLAVTVTGYVPALAVLGVPEIRPLPVFTLSPGGRPVAA